MQEQDETPANATEQSTESSGGLTEPGGGLTEPGGGLTELSGGLADVVNESVTQISFAEKEVLEQKYRTLLVDDLLNNRTHFSAGPYEAHIQFSNFCNMSCIMCWDGNNPPTRKTDPDLLKRIGEQVGPHLSIVTPYSGSEPLVLTWDQTREMDLQFGILL